MTVKETNIFDFLYDKLYFDINKPIRLFEAFSGYGSQQMALKKAGFKIDVVGYSEINKYAILVYEALHGKHKNYGAVGEFERLPKDIDLCTWSFPCQDISLAGKQSGMNEGTRSNYGYVFLDTVKNTPKNERPKVLMMENVKALFYKTFKEDWREIQVRLEDMGYINYVGFLNAKDYGVAQNRDRVFILSFLGKYYYDFPKPYKLKKRLKDYLENEVDEKYYLTEKQIKKIQVLPNKVEYAITHAFSSREHKGAGWNDIAPTLTARDYKDPKVVYIPQPYVLIPEKTKKGFSKANIGDGVYIDRPHQKRGVVQKGMIPALKTDPNDIGVVVEYGKVRKLTPREALRLMDVSESDIDIILANVSNTQAYKLAGNSIVVNVMVEMFKKMKRD